MVSMGAGRATSPARSASLAPDNASFDVCDDRAIHWRFHESSAERPAPVELTLCLVPSRAWCQVNKASKLSGHDPDTQRLYLGCDRVDGNAGVLSRASCAAAEKGRIHTHTHTHKVYPIRKFAISGAEPCHAVRVLLLGGA
jgi:hypothetical protein